MRCSVPMLGLALCGLLAVRCSDDATPKEDTKTEKDAMADVGKTQGDMRAPDGAGAADSKGTSDSSTSVCEAKCLAKAATFCVSDPQDPNDCLECTLDKHCQGNPAAMGPRCDGSLCYCDTNTDCASNGNGKLCDTSYNSDPDKVCSCKVDSDCPSPKKCTVTFSSNVKTCGA